MAFRPDRKQPQFADLKGILAQSRTHLDHATYQTIQQIIERLTQFQSVTLEMIAGLLDEDDATDLFAIKTATYITRQDETIHLPNSIQLLEGVGIDLDYSVPNKLTISAEPGGGYYDAPLTDGNVDETDLIFASGECVIVQVPNP